MKNKLLILIALIIFPATSHAQFFDSNFIDKIKSKLSFIKNSSDSSEGIIPKLRVKNDTPIKVGKYVYKKPDGSVNRDNDGRLVYIAGRFYPYGNVIDNLTGYSTYAVSLERLIYIYKNGAWKMAPRSGVKFNLGGSLVTLKQERLFVKNYGVNSYIIPVEKIGKNLLSLDYVPPSWVKIQYNKGIIKSLIRESFKVSAKGYLVSSKSLYSPQEGDVQIRYVKGGLHGNVTILAEQTSERRLSQPVLGDYKKGFNKIFIIRKGIVPLSEMKRLAKIK